MSEHKIDLEAVDSWLSINSASPSSISTAKALTKIFYEIENTEMMTHLLISDENIKENYSKWAKISAEYMIKRSLEEKLHNFIKTLSDEERLVMPIGTNFYPNREVI